MRGDKYTCAFNRIIGGEQVSFVIDIEVVKQTPYHQIYQYTFADGAVLQFENKVPVPGEKLLGAIPMLCFRIIKPPHENSEDFQVGEVQVLELSTESR